MKLPLLMASSLSLSLSLSLFGCVGSGSTSTSEGSCTTTVSETVERNAVWGDECSDVYITRKINITADLIIQPGTTVRFAEGTEGLEVSDGGSINAVGTEERPIVFEGESHTKNWWGGIAILTVSTQNIFEYVTIRDNGQNTFQFEPYSMLVGGYGVDKGKVILRHVTFENSSEEALTVWEGGSIEGSEYVMFTDIDGVPLTIAFPEAHHVDATFSFDENLTYRFVLFTRGGLDRTVTWQALEVPYRSESNEHFFEESGFLTLNAGAVVEFAQSAEFEVNGKLAALGTSDQPVVLTGIEAVPGYWGGITYGSLSTDNVLKHTIIDYAGGENFQDNEVALIVLGDSNSPGLVEVDNLTIQNSGGGGVLVFKGGSVNFTTPITYHNIAADELVDEN